MKVTKHIIPILLVVAFVAVFLAGCQNIQTNQTADTPSFASFRDIPGVTAGEIEDILRLREQTDHFVFGSLPGMSAFNKEDGEIGGYSALLCAWLTELFGIPFKPAIFEWAELIPGLESMEIDFNGDLAVTSERINKNYFMTDPIAAYTVNYARVAGGQGISEIAAERMPRIVFYNGSDVYDNVKTRIPYEDYEIFYANDNAAIYEMLLNGEADAFLENGHIVAGFDRFSDLETGRFLPLIYSMVSLSTANPELGSIISVVQKALENGATGLLNDLFRAGNSEYLKNKLYSVLTPEEKEYIRNNPVIGYAAEFDNYPVSFYNRHENEWQGAAIDLLAEVRKLTGLEFKIVNNENTPWDDIFDMLKRGEASFVTELILTEDREGLFLWTDRAMFSDNYALISKQDTPNLNYYDIQHMRVGTKSGTAFAEVFERWFPNHRHLIYYDSMDIVFEALAAGEIDLAMASSNRLLRLTNYDEMPGYKANIVFNQPFDSTFGLNSDETVLYSIFNKSLDMIDTSEITGQWLRKSFDYRIMLAEERLPWVISATALLVVLVFLLIIYFRNRNERQRLEVAVNASTAELREAHLELRDAVEKAEAANKAKTSFLARMSHDMRTPLNAILGLSVLSLDAGRLEEEDNSNLTMIKGAGMTLLSLVSDILDVSKIEAGSLKLIPAPYDTPSLINDAVTQSIFHIGEKPIRFTLDLDENLPAQFYGDELRIKQILNNLLSNAFKYTKQGEVGMAVGYVRDESGVWLIVTISDTGVGIRQEDISALFDDYVRIGIETNRRVDGTGLGLPIAKRLAGLMGGSISVESEYGKGSVFTVRLRQEHVTDTPIDPEVAESLKNFKYSEQKSLQEANLPRISLPYARVLVVDDIETNLQIAKGLLKRYSIQVDCVSSGPEAIDAIRDESVRYNAIFMDHMMPDMDGVEATGLIREIDTDYAKNVPIIAFTANAIVGNEEMFLQKGFQGFISKPIELGRLDAVIREWVRDEKVESGKWKVENYSAPPPDSKLLALNSHLSSLNSHYDGIDLDKGIERFYGDGESYVDVLRIYVRNTRLFLEAAGNVSEDRLADYTTIVHGIKGSSRGICADKTADMAEALENAAKTGDYDFISANNASFIETAKTLISGIEEILEQIRDDGPKPKKDKPDEKALEMLREACISHDMDAADTIIAELEAFEYESGGELVVWLRENAEQMNYAEIAQRLSETD